MSNLIKYPFVNLQNKDTYMVDYEKLERENFVPLGKTILEKPVEPIRETNSHAGMQGQFEPGMPVRNFDDLFKEQEEEAKKLAENIVEEARQKAEQILQEAREQIETVREQAREEAVNQGWEEGLAKAEEELKSRKQQIELERAENEKEFQQIMEELEPKYADVLCSLLRKLTGILVTDEKDVMLHLIRSSIVDMNPAKHYIIRVATENVLFVENHKEEILLQTGAGVVVDIQEEKGLDKDECIIETDTQMIDCGFRTQLDNLMMTIRMLAG